MHPPQRHAGAEGVQSTTRFSIHRATQRDEKWTLNQVQGDGWEGRSGGQLTNYQFLVTFRNGNKKHVSCLGRSFFELCSK